MSEDSTRHANVFSDQQGSHAKHTFRSEDTTLGTCDFLATRYSSTFFPQDSTVHISYKPTLILLWVQNRKQTTGLMENL